MTGWFSLQRDIFDHDVFKREPFTEREAWIWIISKAVYEDTTHYVSGVNLPVPRGSFFTTYAELSEVWKWSSTRVRAFQKKLELKEMIVVQKNTKKTFISVCNYDVYQHEPNKKTQKSNAENTEENTKRVQLNNNNTKTTTTGDGDFQNSKAFKDPTVQRMFEALGSPAELKREMDTPHSWLELGCDLEADILPTLRMIAQRNKTIRAWSYCSGAVFDAMDNRENPPKNVRPIRGSQNDNSGSMASMFAQMANTAKDKGL